MGIAAAILAQGAVPLAGPSAQGHNALCPWPDRRTVRGRNALCPWPDRRSVQGHSALFPWPDRRSVQGHNVAELVASAPSLL